MLSFKPVFSPSTFTLIMSLFSSSSHSTIRVASSAYLRLLIFLLAMLTAGFIQPGVLNGLDNHNGVVTNLEQDILDYEVKWAFGSITTNKASGGDRIPAELFQILKNDAVKALYLVYQQIWKSQQWPQDWKRCHSNPKEEQCQRTFKLTYSCTHFTW